MNGVALTDHPDLLRRTLHEEIDRLSPPRLAVFHRVLLQLELADAADQLDRDFEAARADGHLSPEKIDEAIRAARAVHPYA
jgi:hypothetical protein